jgi:O-antigen/teichoic acid export membrane protein
MLAQRIAKNSAALFVSRTLQMAFTALFSIYAARMLGTTDFGKWAFALAYTTFFLVFADFGLSIVVNQRVARCRESNPKEIGRLVGGSLFIKLVLVIPVFAIMVGLANLFGHDNDTRDTVYLLGISVLFNSFSVFLAGVFRGLEKMEYETVATALERPLILVVGAWLLVNGKGIVSLALLFLVARLFTLFFAVTIYAKRVRLVSFERDFYFLKELVVGALPFGIFVILGTIYFQIDTIMILLLQDNEAVGLFESVIRLALVLMIIPEAFTEAIFPVFSRSFHLGQDQTYLYHKALKLIAIVGLPITVILLVLADRLILFLYGAEYLPAVPALRLIALMVCVRFLAYVPGVLLSSIDRQTTRVIVVGTCAAINVIANLIVIPRWGFVGAAFNTLLTHIILLCLYIAFVWQSGYSLKVRHLGTMLRILACVGLLFLLIATFRDLSLLMLIPASIVLYCVFLLLLGVVKGDERTVVKGIFTFGATHSR